MKEYENLENIEQNLRNLEEIKSRIMNDLDKQHKIIDKIIIECLEHFSNTFEEVDVAYIEEYLEKRLGRYTDISYEGIYGKGGEMEIMVFRDELCTERDLFAVTYEKKNGIYEFSMIKSCWDKDESEDD